RALGLDEFLRFDLSIVRGLAYYTGIVWELFDVAGDLRAVAGGGRYDRLLAHLTDVDLPALGFGMGDVVLRELLSDKELLPSTDRTMDFFVVAVSDDQREAVLSLVSRLRASGRSVDYSLSGGGVGKQFKAASAAGAARVVVIGPDEVARGVVKVRDMSTGQEAELTADELADSTPQYT
ncbi:MAG TPA: His/Gly/Thr/Pro-type tRNA ligase C-terminal domain-containing protein, partial [Actinomycetota bacterium]|nr:His/Gly/Thr/Pro-type tRNA ligase C-terminal domain-containing protein [Actinomycetota bacterium]